MVFKLFVSLRVLLPLDEKLRVPFKKLSSIIYVTVPFTGNDNFDRSLEIFSKNVSV